MMPFPHFLNGILRIVEKSGFVIYLSDKNQFVYFLFYLYTFILNEDFLGKALSLFVHINGVFN